MAKGWFFAFASVLLIFVFYRQTTTPKVANSLPKFSPPKNIILLIGDGMGLSQISAYHFDQFGKSYFEYFNSIGFQKTHADDNLITDSAASGTAMFCGEKTKNTMIGVRSDSSKLESFFEEGKKRGMDVGFVVSSSVVHATPAAMYAHNSNRGDYEGIAKELIKCDFDFMVGGGEKYFSKRSVDKRNLLKELKQKQYLLTNYEPRLNKIQIYEKIIWFTAEEDPVSIEEGRRYLPKATEVATNFLSKDSTTGFLLMVEGSQIDWALHAKDGERMLSEMKDFDKAVGKALAFAKQDGETLVIVTADHECGGMSVGGKKIGKVKMDFTGKFHTGVMVPVFAYGPGAEVFEGIYDNTEIYQKVRSVLGWDRP